MRKLSVESRMSMNRSVSIGAILRKGWLTTGQHLSLIIALFIYDLIWGSLLYKYVQSIISPLLHRFPNPSLSDAAVPYFLAEGQFQITKTALSHPMLWTLLGFLIFRMFFTPLINAGLYYSIHHYSSRKKVQFFKGVRILFLPFLFLYWLRMTLTLAPLFWILPWLYKTALSSPDYLSILSSTAPVLVGFLLYMALLSLGFMYMQLYKTTEQSMLYSIAFIARFPHYVIGLCAALLLITLLITTLTVSISLAWAGVIAVILHQFHHLFKMSMKVWNISVQYHLIQERS